MKFDNSPQGSEAWLAARAGVITASTFSDCVKLVDGLDDKQTIYVDAIRGGKTEEVARALAGYKGKPTSTTVADAIAGKPVGRISDASNKLALQTAIEQISGKPYGPPQGSFFATERGHEQEDYARMRYEARFGVIVEEAGLALTDDNIFGYSTDGFVGDDGGIEVKTPLDTLKVLAIIQTGDISEYMHQMQGGLWLTGRRWIDFLMAVPDLAALNNGNELYVKRVYRDEAFIEQLELDLWAHAGRVKKFKELLSQPYRQAANDSTGEVQAAA